MKKFLNDAILPVIFKCMSPFLMLFFTGYGVSFNYIALFGWGVSFRFRHGLLDKVADLGGKDVLVLGCGSGNDIRSLLSFSPRRVVGVDLYSDSAWESIVREGASKGVAVEFIEASVFDYNFNDVRFDVVVGDAFLQHVTDPEYITTQLPTTERKE